MKYFFDTEFIERGSRHPIELISIGIVAEDGREFYTISSEFDPSHASQWVRDNVIAKLGDYGGLTASLAQISEAIQGFCNPEKYGKPELWAYFADYDWVVFCQTFGTMMDLPHDYPMWCRDLKQLAWSRGIDKLPEQGKGEHNALDDARWNKRAYDFIEAYENVHMTEIMRLKKISEDLQKQVQSTIDSMTPHPVVMLGSEMTVEFSPRDVGDMYEIIHRLSNARVGDDWIECKKQAQRFVGGVKLIGR